MAGGVGGSQHCFMWILRLETESRNERISRTDKILTIHENLLLLAYIHPSAVGVALLGLSPRYVRTAEVPHELPGPSACWRTILFS